MGYGLMQDVDELSGGELPIGPGTLYTAIKRPAREQADQRKRRRRRPSPLLLQADEEGDGGSEGGSRADEPARMRLARKHGCCHLRH